MTGSRVAWRAAVVLLLIALAGCGKSEVEEFADRLRPVDQELSEQKARVATTLRTVRLRDRAGARSLRRQIGAIARIGEAMADLDPPGEVESVFDRYLRATEAQVKALERVAAALANGDRARLGRESVRATLSEGAVRRASDDLRDRLNEG